MSSNFNNAKIINVYYNKGDRKPYDVNGKPIAYIGEEFVGANEATELRFFLGEALDSGSAFIIAKRPNNDTRIDQLTFEAGANPYFKIALNAWYSEYKGKMTIIFKAYNGTVTFNEANTEITATSGRIVVSDIFNLEIAYAPLATSTVPPYDPDPETSWYFALSSKLDKEQSITIVGTTLPALVDDEYDERFLMTNTGGVTRLYYINENTAEEVLWQVGTLKLSATGGAEVTTDTGKVSFDTTYGGFKYTQIRDVVGYIGQDIEYYGKAVGTIAKGDVIQFDGVDGVHFLIKKAVPADVNANPEIILGIAKQGLTNGQFGYVLHFGRITGINLTAYADENYLWFASASANNGELTTTQPTAPNAKIVIGVVVDNGASGTLLVRPMIQPSLKDLKDIHITSIANNQVLRWNTANLRWENTSALTTAETDIDALEGRMTTEEGNVDSLEGRMTTAEGDIDDIEDGTTIVPKALADQNGNVINTTYLTQSSASATYIPLSQKGVANGVTPLGSNGKVPSIYLSGEQDDLAEFADLASFPAVGETDILYVALDTNKLYRWSGSAYVVISETLAIGTTNTTAFAGDRGLALETLTDNIVDGSQALALKDQVIRNTVVGTSPLVVNSIASTTANLTEFQVNGTKVLEVTPAGGLNQNGTRLFTQTGATTNTFFGLSSANSTLTGTEQVAVGESALNGLTNGNRNTAVGRASLLLTTTGADNTAIGTRSGQSNTTGVGNTFIGRDSGNNASQLATATNSTALGHQAFTDKSNQMVFGNASVTEFKFDRNTGATALLPIVSSAHHTITGSVSGNTTFSLYKNTSTNVALIGHDGAITGTSNGFGVYVYGNNPLELSTNNVKRLVITGGGNVGIGTASPDYKFHVKTTDTSTTIGANIVGRFETSATNADVSLQLSDGVSSASQISHQGGALHFRTSNTTRTTITSAGNVGIGTTTPQDRLSVSGSLTNLTSEISIINTDGSPGGKTTLRTGIFGLLNSGLSILTANADGSSEVARMVIRADGNVGIGTTTPSNKLESVDSSATTFNGLGIYNTLPYGGANFSDKAESILNLGKIEGSARQPMGAIGASPTSNGSSNDGYLSLYTRSSGALSERIRIITTGLVGINETAPTAQLQVKSGATTRVPLIVDTISGFDQALGLEEFRVNTSVVARINGFGSFATLGSIFNLTNINNANITPASTGTSITRNVADTNPALIVNLSNASATGNIQVWQKAGSAVAQISNAGIFVGQSRPTRTDITANATLALADEGKVLRVNPVTAADNITITVPPNGDVAFVVDTEIAIVRFNTGTVTIVAGSGVTIRSKNSETKISGQYGSVALKKIGENEWVLVGSLEA